MHNPSRVSRAWRCIATGLVRAPLWALLCSLLAPAHASQPGEDAVLSFMRSYHDTFDSGHARDIVAMYDAPLYLMAPNGDVRSFDTPKDIRLTVKKWKRYMIHSGFARTELKTLSAHLLTDDTAIASTAFHRHSTKGQVFQRGGATYTLRRRDGEWRIYMIQVHAPERAIEFD